MMMLRCLAMAVLASFCAPAALAQPSARPAIGSAPTADVALRGPTDPQELEAFLDGLMAAHLKEHDIAGAVVSVVRGDEVLFAKGFGYADVDQKRPVDPARTLFQIGSVSKLFTWTAVMQLVEEGELELDSDINTYLDFQIPATYAKPITLFHLLTHTAGFEDRIAGLYRSEQIPRGQWLVDNLPARVREPGAFSSYSNYGAVLAGYIVERVSGLPWEEYVETRILGPLDIRYSSAWDPLPEALSRHMSVGYALASHPPKPEKYGALISAAPAGSVSASGLDMARFMIAHLQLGRLREARILKEETARQMQSRAFGHDERLPGFALGFYERNSNGLRILRHGGNTPWFNTDLALIPEEGLGVFVSYNSRSGGKLSSDRFLAAFLDHYYPKAELSGAAPVPQPGGVQRFLGSYRANRASSTTFEKVMALFAPISVAAGSEPGELILRVPGENIRLISAGPNWFREVDGSEKVVFRQDASGAVTYMFRGSAPMVAMERLSWYDTPAFHGVLLGASLLLFLSVLIAAPARYLVQRRFPQVAPVQGTARTARRVAIMGATLNLVFALGFFVWLGAPHAFLLRGETGALRVLLGLPVLAIGSTLVMVKFTVAAWRRGLWSRWARVHYTAVTAGALVFAAVLGYWNLLGWQF